MTLLTRFRRDQLGASAAEFALVAPLMILFLLGIIDVGRFIWYVNEAEKATQIGARWAVATDMIPTDLYNYSFSAQPSGAVPQGEVVPIAKFPGVTCQVPNAGTAVSCSCKAGGSCPFGMTPNTTAFTNLATRMNTIYGGIRASNVVVDYEWSGLGYAGDPNGSDVDPLVRVRTKNLAFRPIFLAGIFNFGLPNPSYALTAEDSEGTFAH